MPKAVSSNDHPRLPEFWRRLDPDAVLDTLADAVFLVDAAGRIIFWNRGAERITGFSGKEAQGRICSFLKGWIWHQTSSDGADARSCEQGDGGAAPCCSLFDLGTIDSQECDITRKDGTVARIVRSARILRDDDGKVVGGIHNFSDLTPIRTLEARLAEAERERSYRDGLGGLVGRSPQMQHLFELIDRVAPTDATVVIQGESGTGKELVARALHERSVRSGRPFVAVNVAALPASLLESELFGHVRGAFTGAVQDRAGRFELASGGTLFLDEIGDLPLELQPKLLRALQERTVERVGEARPRKVDVRVVAATNRDLRQQVSLGEFRDDLYYRLNVLNIYLPPLRERRGDIPLLVHRFIKELGKRHDRPFRGITAEAMQRLVEAPWPGNVRQLHNLIESMVVLAPGSEIRASDIPADILEGPGRMLPMRITPQPGREMPGQELEFILRNLMDLRLQVEELRRRLNEGPQRVQVIEVGEHPMAEVFPEPPARQDGDVIYRPGMTMAEVEKAAIEAALHEFEGNRRRAAEVLGIGERTLYRKIKAYQLG